MLLCAQQAAGNTESAVDVAVYLHSLRLCVVNRLQIYLIEHHRLQIVV